VEDDFEERGRSGRVVVLALFLIAVAIVLLIYAMLR
jgi:hypothetical protein